VGQAKPVWSRWLKSQPGNVSRPLVQVWKYRNFLFWTQINTDNQDTETRETKYLWKSVKIRVLFNSSYELFSKFYLYAILARTFGIAWRRSPFFPSFSAYSATLRWTIRPKNYPLLGLWPKLEWLRYRFPAWHITLFLPYLCFVKIRLSGSEFNVQGWKPPTILF
jgi:hypothetical protein